MIRRTKSRQGVTLTWELLGDKAQDTAGFAVAAEIYLDEAVIHRPQ